MVPRLRYNNIGDRDNYIFSNMATVSISELQQNYKKQALQLMLKYDEPTLKQIHHQVCMRNNCPVEHCTYFDGFKRGEDCGHVLHVRDLIRRISDVVDGY